MFASHPFFVFACRSPGQIAAALLACVFTLAAPASAISAPLCKPVLTVGEVRFSPTDRETMQRRWTARISVDASRCATASGKFEIMFTRLKETGPDLDFTEAFVWTPGMIEVALDFDDDEAVAAFWVQGVAPCPCRE